METDLQKANIWKRISAALLDMILTGIIIVGVGYLLSLIFSYDAKINELNSTFTRYEEEYNIKLHTTGAEYESMSPEMQERFDAAIKALNADKEAIRVYNIIINLTLLITSLSIFIGCFITEFIVPLFLKNGQTLGKKIFSIGVMHTSGIRVTPLLMFIRTVLGKYTLETMVPLLIAMMIFFNATGLVGTIVLFAFLILQIVLLIATHTNSLLHDILAKTVVIDMASQRIFANGAELLEYKKKLHAEATARQPY